MPYIKQDDREKFEDSIREIAENAENAGDLNYTISTILHLYIKKKGLRYANCNEVMGMLTCCQMELYRVLVGRYEDEKMVENHGLGVFTKYEENIPQGIQASSIRERLSTDNITKY